MTVRELLAILALTDPDATVVMDSGTHMLEVDSLNSKDELYVIFNLERPAAGQPIGPEE